MPKITIRNPAFCLAKPWVLDCNMQHIGRQNNGFCKNKPGCLPHEINRKQKQRFCNES